MSRVMFVNPWLYGDENVPHHDLFREWRNGPYSLLLLSSQLLKHGHQVMVADLARDLVHFKGRLSDCLENFARQLLQFKPDILGVGFFSVHYLEVSKIVRFIRKLCEKNKLSPYLVGGGIHASIEPVSTLADIPFDALFVGEADTGIVKLANGTSPNIIPGLYTGGEIPQKVTIGLRNLDEAPFPDWGLVDHAFYSHPTYARIGFRKSSSLDILLGRGCAFRCSFCAYSSLSTMRYHSVGYITEQIREMRHKYNINSVYFLDSTIGTNTRLLTQLCQSLIEQGLYKNFEWYANIRADQVDRHILKLMWDAGCRYLFYGFESGSQRVLDMMNKKVSVETNYKIAKLHNAMKFPYNASLIIGYPGETEKDIVQTLKFIKTVKPPRVGVNWYVPLPGSDDYRNLKDASKIHVSSPSDWRGLGNIGELKNVYADVPEDRFRFLYKKINEYVSVELKRYTDTIWGRA